MKLNVEVEENANLLFERAVLDHDIGSGSTQFDPGLILAGWNKGNTLREIQLEPLQGYLTEFSHLDSEVYATTSWLLCSIGKTLKFESKLKYDRSLWSGLGFYHVWSSR